MDLTRRDILATTLASTLGAAAATPARAETPPSTTEAHGTVRDAATGAPLPDILVSNGRDIVRTGQDGAFTLSVQDGDSVFVIKPRGWMVPTEPGTNLPRFAHVHAPAGTPAGLALRYPGLPPNPLPSPLDFRLTRRPEPDRVQALLFTDPQPESEAELGHVRDTAVAQAATLAAAGGVAFGITTGDIMFDDLALYPRSNRLIGQIGLPWWNLPGNHDMNYEAPDDRHSRETFKRLFGARHYAFQWGPATFVMLDNVEYLGAQRYRGRIGAGQLAFLKNLLALLPPEAPVIVCMHVPLRTVVGEEPNSATIDWQEFLGTIAGRPNCVSFAGHTHTNEHHYLGPDRHHHHVLAAVSGSWWSGPETIAGIPVALATDGTPNGFHVLTVDGPRIATRFVPCQAPEAPQMRILLDSHFARRTPELAQALPLGAVLGATVAADALPATRVLVNFFPGGPRSHLSLAVNGKPAGDLTPLAGIDPFVQQVYWRHAAAKKPWVQPVPCSHLWAAPLPALPPGAHLLTVTATDEHGAPHLARLPIEVTG